MQSRTSNQIRTTYVGVSEIRLAHAFHLHSALESNCYESPSRLPFPLLFSIPTASCFRFSLSRRTTFTWDGGRACGMVGTWTTKLGLSSGLLTIIVGDDFKCRRCLSRFLLRILGCESDWWSCFVLSSEKRKSKREGNDNFGGKATDGMDGD